MDDILLIRRKMRCSFYNIFQQMRYETAKIFKVFAFLTRGELCIDRISISVYCFYRAFLYMVRKALAGQ